MNEYIMEVTVRENDNEGCGARMIRKMILNAVAKADDSQLCKYYKKYCELHNVEFSDMYFKCSGAPNTVDFKPAPAELWDYAKLVQHDIEGDTIRNEEKAPDVLNYLAYALSKHECKNFGDEPTIVHSKEVNEKALYTFFYMAVAAGYNMALEEK
jgi:hypothetical protein